MPDKPGARGDARRATSAPPLSLQVVTRAPSDDGSARSSRPRMRSRSSRTVCMGEELPSVRRGRQLSVPAPKPLPREIRVPGARARQTGKELLAERRSIVSGRVGICRRPVPLPHGRRSGLLARPTQRPTRDLRAPVRRAGALRPHTASRGYGARRILKGIQDPKRLTVPSSYFRATRRMP